MSPLSCPDSGLRSASPSSKALLEDLDLRILTERLRLLQSQRELAALRCQRFTDLLEAQMHSTPGSEEEAQASDPAVIPRSKSAPTSQRRRRSPRAHRRSRTAVWLAMDSHV